MCFPLKEKYLRTNDVAEVRCVVFSPKRKEIKYLGTNDVAEVRCVVFSSKRKII